jgi:hypothetical protein
MFVSGCSFFPCFYCLFLLSGFHFALGGCEALEELLEFAKLSKA